MSRSRSAACRARTESPCLDNHTKRFLGVHIGVYPPRRVQSYEDFGSVARKRQEKPLTLSKLKGNRRRGCFFRTRMARITRMGDGDADGGFRTRNARNSRMRDGDADVFFSNTDGTEFTDGGWRRGCFFSNTDGTDCTDGGWARRWWFSNTECTECNKV